jgi:long-chain acyl-CoA synthetase
MNDQSRVFDFFFYQLNRFPQEAMFSAKENGQWTHHSTQSVIDVSTQLSAGLLSLGLSGHSMDVEQQDKIAIISRNRPEWLMLDLACQQIGVLLCPIYPTTNPNEVAFILNDAQVKYVFVSGEDMLDKVNSIQQQVTSLIKTFTFDPSPRADVWTSLLSSDQGLLDQVAGWKERIQPEHCVTIIYTSGTTGFPKGVMLSHRNLVTNVLNATNTFPFPEAPGSRSLSFLPLNHIFERMASYIYIYTGINIFYAENMETIGENLKEVKPILFSTVPRLLEKMYDKIMANGSALTGITRWLFFWAVGLAERYQLQGGSVWYRLQLALANALIFKKWRAALGGQVQYVITGGAACQEKLLRIFNAAQIPVFEGYGPTENSPVISVNCNKPNGMCFGTVGLVVDGQEVKLLEDGEICVRGSSVMMGYYKRPDLTAEVIKDGWLHTGDVGVYVDNRYLKITDRKKELFKTSGGKYIAPQYLENKLKESPYIEQLMIVGENRKYVAAIIVPSFTALEAFAQSQSIAVNDRSSLIQHPAILAFMQKEVDQFNAGFNQVEQIKKFALLDKEWSVETGELTPKLSMRRKVISEQHAPLIDSLFQ